MNRERVLAGLGGWWQGLLFGFVLGFGVAVCWIKPPDAWGLWYWVIVGACWLLAIVPRLIADFVRAVRRYRAFTRDSSESLAAQVAGNPPASGPDRNEVADS